MNVKCSKIRTFSAVLGQSQYDTIVDPRDEYSGWIAYMARSTVLGRVGGRCHQESNFGLLADG